MTPHQLVKGTGIKFPLNFTLNTQLEKPKHLLVGMIHLLSPIVGSEVNDSRPVGSRH